MHSILVVEDDPKIRANLLFQVKEHGFDLKAVSDAEQAFALLKDEGKPLPDLLLLDVRLPGISGVELARSLSELGRLPPTIIISGEASITETVEALKLGVHDFIEKPFSKERLLRSMRNTLENAALKQEVKSLRSALSSETEILGESPAMTELLEKIDRAAPTDGRVLILGESGTGKELVANALHAGSPRHEQPFIKINCAAIPNHLIEDELFGHVKGAFTDARNAKPGLFEEAHGGTLFLDEIGDMDYQLQSRLLRVLEDGRVRRIGDTRDREVDVRVIAATHRNMEEAIRKNTFREDLYFRLAHLPIEIPPLRERAGDVSLLFQHFVELYCRRHKSRPRRIDEEVLRVLEGYRWPGNVRQLSNLSERLVVFAGDPITLEHLPSPFFDASEEPGLGLLRLPQTSSFLPLRAFKAQCEKEYIEHVLQRLQWNFTAAAKALEIQRTYLHQKVNSLGIRRPRDSAAKVSSAAVG